MKGSELYWQLTILLITGLMVLPQEEKVLWVSGHTRHCSREDGAKETS